MVLRIFLPFGKQVPTAISDAASGLLVLIQSRSTKRNGIDIELLNISMKGFTNERAIVRIRRQRGESRSEIRYRTVLPFSAPEKLKMK